MKSEMKPIILFFFFFYIFGSRQSKKYPFGVKPT